MAETKLPQNPIYLPLNQTFQQPIFLGKPIGPPTTSRGKSIAAHTPIMHTDSKRFPLKFWKSIILELTNPSETQNIQTHDLCFFHHSFRLRFL